MLASLTFVSPPVMRYEVERVAANCSSFSLSHRSNLKPWSKASQTGDISAIQVVSCEKTNERHKRGKLHQTDNKKKSLCNILETCAAPFLFLLPEAEPVASVRFSRSNRSERRHRSPECPSTLNLSPRVHTCGEEITHTH